MEGIPMSPRSDDGRPASAQTVTVRTASGQEFDYPWATSVRVDRRGDLRVMQGLRQRAFHPCAEWADYTVRNLRRSPSGS
jgi:hypothetical protein